MLSKSLNGKNASLMIQVFLVFVWLTDLSVLAGTDTYYSVYLLCGVLGIMALCKRADRKRTLSGKQRFALAIAGGGDNLGRGLCKLFHFPAAICTGKRFSYGVLFGWGILCRLFPASLVC